jgi:hypothetical protein
MRRHLLIGAPAVAAVIALSAAASAQSMPQLVSARSQHRHLVLVARFGDLAPREVRVAIRPATGGNGALLAGNVRFDVAFSSAVRTASGERWRSPQLLRRGVYWVQVSGVETDGVTDCPPKLRNCATHWSNVRRVVVP